jgi:excisionase family DNA binding protein
VNDRWLSVVEISEYLGITRDSVYKWVKQKGMPAHRLGKLWKFKTDEVDLWMREGGANEEKSETKSKTKS